MSVTGALSIAASGLDTVQYALSVASQNVANASTTGYVRENATLVAMQGNGVGSGVRQGLTVLASDPALQQQAWAENATVAGLSTTSTSLAAINTLLGSTAAGSTTAAAASSTLSDSLGTLQSAFISLSSDPADATTQQNVVTAAGAFATQLNGLSQAYQAQRQSAQDTIAAAVQSTANDLQTIGSLSNRIVQLKAQGSDTADLENQRSAVMGDLAQYVSVKFQATSAGDMLVKTTSGLKLPTRGATTLTTSDATVGLADAYPGTIAAVTLGGTDVTSLLKGGTIGAAVTLRDTTLPTMQAQLDSLAGATATRFSAAGLDLFTTASGSLPGASGSSEVPAGQLGFSAQIGVNPSVSANTSLVRDGTGSPSANTTGAVDYQGTIEAVLTGSFATGQATATSTGLGVNGTLSIGYSGSASLTDLATNLTASQAAASANASSQLTTEQAIQTKLTTALGSATGVDVDQEMASVVSLQNSYEANAKVIAAVQSMFSALINAVNV